MAKKEESPKEGKKEYEKEEGGVEMRGQGQEEIRRVKRSLYGRKIVRGFRRTHGGKRLYRPIEEKLKKYEVRGEGYEFVPALMHLVERYVSGIPEDVQNEMDKRLARALDKIPEAKGLLETAVEEHNKIPRELKRRAFSPKYLDLKIDQGIDIEEARAIVLTAGTLRNRRVRDIAAWLPAVGLSELPGAHKDVRCSCCCPDEPPPDRPDPPPPPPNEYELTFTKLYCVDESNPEYIWMPWPFDNINIHDEPYGVFGVITEEMAEAGTEAWAFHTPVYEGVDDGDTRPTSGDENLRLFGFAGPRPINSSVLITAVCFENDLGDVSDTTDAVRTALTAVATKAAAAGGVAGWIVAGVAVVGIGVTYLVDLIGADDAINGTLAVSLTEAQADAMTSAVNPVILDPLHFDGGDSDGIYDMYLKLRRV